jgi:glyoxalase family protein
MRPVQGLHHLTVMASDPQRNIDFYAGLLAQRLVKVTVNFDDPGTYHLYYGDEVGTPGTIMTFFPWPNALPGERGNGEVAAASYAVDPASLPYWRERLAEHRVAVSDVTHFGSPALAFVDPDGLHLEIVAEAGAPVPRFWPDSPVPSEHALRGFHGVTLWVESERTVATLLTRHLGFQRVGSENDEEGTRTRYRGASDGVGLFVDVVERPGKPHGRFSAGSVHHVAMRTRDDSEQVQYQEALRAAGYHVTPVQDRQYFHSIYFRDATGVLFEIATDAPGFASDEPVAELGKNLQLPAWYEPQRAAIESRVKRIVNPEYGVSIGGLAGGATPRRERREAARFSGPHQGQPVHTAGRSLEEARVAMILLHGRGSNPRDILGLADAFSMSAFAYLAPQAQGGTWYPLGFMNPLERNEPGLSSGLQAIADALDELAAHGISEEKVIIGGFSQGACLASEFVARNARRYGGLVAFSGGLIGPDGTPRDYPGALEGTPVFLGCSDIDPHIPLGRVEETARVLADLGGRIDKRIYPRMGHAINEDELNAVREMMRLLAAESL